MCLFGQISQRDLHRSSEPQSRSSAALLPFAFFQRLFGVFHLTFDEGRPFERGIMKTTELLARKCIRLPLYPHEIKKIPFKTMTKMQLRNEVSGKSEKGADVSCLQEMAVMFACMKKHDFKEVKCAEEISTFNKCYTDYTAKKKAAKQREESGQIVTGTNARSLTTKQLNQLLKKYPQHNKEW